MRFDRLINYNDNNILQDNVSRRVRIPLPVKKFAKLEILNDERPAAERPTLRDIYLSLIQSGHKAWQQNTDLITWHKVEKKHRQELMYFPKEIYFEFESLRSEIRSGKYPSVAENRISLEEIIIQFLKLGFNIATHEKKRAVEKGTGK